MASNRLAPIVFAPRGKHTATLIFLHGLGDTGHGWAMTFNHFAPSYLKVVCPNAAQAPVTLNMGMVMPSWYDIFHLDDNPGRPRENLDQVEESVKYLETVIQNETGPDIPRSRIMIGGFSQGGAVALSTLFRGNTDVAGCLALSTYMPGNKKPDLPDGAKIDTPIFQCHGEDDEVISFQRGQLTNDILNSLANNVTFKAMKGMGHENNLDEMEMVTKFMMDKFE